MKNSPTRRKSKLTKVGNRAKQKAEAALLIKTLRENDWSLTLTAKVLDMGHPSSVLAALTRFDLLAQYHKAKKKRSVHV